MAILFISDLHLSEDQPQITQTFIQLLLDKNRIWDQLYILGDLFEVWIGDDNLTSLNQSIQNTLKTLNDQDIKVYIMHGNRDFMLGDLFEKNTGCVIIPDPYVVDLYGNPTLLTHGDALCTDDQAYQTLRQQLRSTVWKKNMLEKSLEERREFAQQARSQSKIANKNKTAAIMDVNENCVLEIMEKYQVSTMIHGHTHRPNTHIFQDNGIKKYRYVLGDWHRNAWALLVTQNTWQPYYWSLLLKPPF